MVPPSGTGWIHEIKHDDLGQRRDPQTPHLRGGSLAATNVRLPSIRIGFRRSSSGSLGEVWRPCPCPRGQRTFGAQRPHQVTPANGSQVLRRRGGNGASSVFGTLRLLIGCDHDLIVLAGLTTPLSAAPLIPHSRRRHAGARSEPTVQWRWARMR
jgi:hypothetical protein